MGESLAGQAYEAIRNEIITCRLRPGQQIAQPQLAERYQTGTTPVRDALQRLAQEGLVQPIPRFGYLVTQITLSDVTEMYELRSILSQIGTATHASWSTTNPSTVPSPSRRETRSSSRRSRGCSTR